MKDYENNNAENAQESQEENGGLPAELTDSGAETTFVTETPKSRTNALMLPVFLVLLGCGVIYFMHLRAGPKSAAANTETDKASKTINEFLSGGTKNIDQMQQTLKNTEKAVQQFLAQPAMNQVSVEDLKTNPFRHSVEPQEDDATRKARLEAERKAKEKEGFGKLIAGLQLQFILSGKTPSCMISSKTYTEGQTVGDGVIIEKIQPDCVIVSKGELKAQLSMKR